MGKGGATRPLRVLVVEDEPLTRTTLVQVLRGEGHEVRGAGCVPSSRAALKDERADVILLDLGLPGESGMDFARELRATSDCGLIVVSRQSDAATRIAALDVGADDYLTKPVDFEELAARVRSVARRALRSGAGGVWQIGPLRLDAGARQVTVDGAAVTLTRGEFDLLQALAEAGTRIVTREALSARVARGEGDLRSVDALVSRLRRKLGAEAGGLIETAPGFGYRLQSRPGPN